MARIMVSIDTCLAPARGYGIHLGSRRGGTCMRCWSTLVVAVGAALWGSGPVHGQALQGTRFTDPATLVQNPTVQKHLDVTEEQKQKVFNIPILIRQQAAQDVEAIRQIKDPAEKEKKRQELKKKTMAAGTAALAKHLTADQLKRLQQIALQMYRLQAYE